MTVERVSEVEVFDDIEREGEKGRYERLAEHCHYGAWWFGSLE